MGLQRYWVLGGGGSMLVRCHRKRATPTTGHKQSDMCACVRVHVLRLAQRGTSQAVKLEEPTDTSPSEYITQGKREKS